MFKSWAAFTDGLGGGIKGLFICFKSGCLKVFALRTCMDTYIHTYLHTCMHTYAKPTFCLIPTAGQRAHTPQQSSEEEKLRLPAPPAPTRTRWPRRRWLRPPYEPGFSSKLGTHACDHVFLGEWYELLSRLRIVGTVGVISWPLLKAFRIQDPCPCPY